MCSGSKNTLWPNLAMEEGQQHRNDDGCSSVLLELAASNDVFAFKSEIEEKSCDVDEAGFWYGRRIGSSKKKMGFEERTPLMIASTFGSVEVVKYILETRKSDVNRASAADKVTALHCAASGGSDRSLEVVKLLLDASADVDSVDCNGNKPNDVIASGLPSGNSRRKALSKLLLLKGDDSCVGGGGESGGNQKEQKPTSFKVAYPVDVSLPDINNGIYSTDEFRMYTFKVKPCSRAYSHDWTECPFVHHGENARRRDPRKYPYSCVPCPEFRKGTCQKSDVCEYAHGVFESWLHPAQYKTRLCKDETGCSRKVCFFAHKPEELRPVYASTGSAMPSPKSFGGVVVPPPPEMTSLTLGPSSTPPMSPKGGGGLNMMWTSPPTLQLPGSRLKAAMSAQEFDHLELELLEKLARRGLSSSLSCLRPTNLDDTFGLSSSPTGGGGIHMRQQNMNMNMSMNTNINSHPTSPYGGFDSSSAMAAAVMNSRSAAMTKRSQSFIDRGTAIQHHPGPIGISSPNSSSSLSGWSSPDGKLDWGIRGDELNKLRKSASFGIRSNNSYNNNNNNSVVANSFSDEPDVSWVNSLVRDGSPQQGGGEGGEAVFGSEKKQQQQRSRQGGGGGIGMNQPYPYIEAEQMVV